MMQFKRRHQRLLLAALATIAVVVLVSSILLPVIAGLGETVWAAFGILPAIGKNSFSLEAWQQLLELPGLKTSLRLTLVSGFAATLLSLILALAGSAWFYDQVQSSRIRSFKNLIKPVIKSVLVPILAAPHAAMAIGLAFLLAPSGWLSRWFSPWLTGWNLPPDWAIVQDLWGLSLTLGLVVKELPFLWLVSLVALKQIAVQQQLAVAQSMGYSHAGAWLKVIVPQLYPLIRLPVLVVLVYSLSTVDMAQVLGPNNPPTLALATMRWFNDANIQLWLPASAAALSMGILIAISIVTWGVGKWGIGERVIGMVVKNRTRAGRRNSVASILVFAVIMAILILLFLGLLALIVLGLWSVTWRWSFPDILPASWSSVYWWELLTHWPSALQNSLVLALSSSSLAMLLAMAWLEMQDHYSGHFHRLTTWIIYVPLLVPQIAFLYGLKVGFLRLGLNGGISAVIWAHLLFVLPYVMLSLVGPWRALDKRYSMLGASLGYSHFDCFWRIKLALLLKPLLLAWAIGIAVSISQYLPTLMIGAGRIDSLTTEAVSVASGADRRLVGVYGLIQALVPLLAYSMALLLPKFVFLKGVR